ncbi:glucose-1-phosphate adenylyltransferase subunit GlgD [Lawsonibacter hominis]|uniref:glucose-1-phosphate adenylyltransferase subunit GlgD n=1 Tax=Lawsonibacter hominis TaxID=2763053 RepID=UPI00331BCA4F
MMNQLHGIIFAYLSNPDLRELTQHRNTCSIPYGGRYRIIDFMLSNLVNAGIDDVGLIVHTNYQSLLDHVGSGKDWDLSRKHGGLRILPPFGYANKREGVYRGRMDALAGVRSYLQNIRQDYVVLAGGDLAVNLPITDIFEQHLKCGADITAVCTRQPKGDPKCCDYFTIGASGRVSDVAVHPALPQGCESLEVYILSKSLLLSLVDHCAAHNIPSFSTGVLQPMVDALKIFPYVFDGYAARLQSVAGYFARSMELLDPQVRRQLFVPERPVKTKDQSNPSTYYGPGAHAVNSLVADGCIIEGEVENSILFRGVRVEKGARVSGCVLFQGTAIQAGAVLKYAITDKNVRVNPGRMLMGHSTYPLAIAKNEIV